MSIAVLYEHPEWFQPMFAELERRGLPLVRFHAGALNWSPAEPPAFSLLINRMSPSAYLRGQGHAIHATAAFLGYVESHGVPVVNDLSTYRLETSKSAQLDLFERVSAPYPATRLINHPSQAAEAAEKLRFPIVVKPNIGGSGAGIVKFETPEELARTVRDGRLDLGPDDTALVQEALTSPDGSITRVEVLDGVPLYAIKITPPEGHGFNLCPADICQEDQDGDDIPPLPPETDRGQPLGSFCPTKPAMQIERTDVHPDIVDAIVAVARAAGLDICGIEYIIDQRDGRPYVYDVNALSNFVTDADEILGFDPFVPLADFIEAAWKAAGDRDAELVSSV
jgi:glutathione synthase/RimK-type ligase-like ATP-grasp enzyme